MFEGKTPFLQEADAYTGGENRGEDLHRLSWPVLVARLAAARDLNAVVTCALTDDFASFDAPSARRLAAHTDRPDGHGKQDVNPLALANGKGTRCNAGERTDCNDQADRGNT